MIFPWRKRRQQQRARQREEARRRVEAYLAGAGPFGMALAGDDAARGLETINVPAVHCDGLHSPNWPCQSCDALTDVIRLTKQTALRVALLEAAYGLHGGEER